jgi:tyrosinase
MAFTRRNVFELGGDWADPILWYARGVKAMMARGLNEPTSWRFYGAIHGFNRAMWQQVGAFTAGEPQPSRTDIQTYWEQCQHGSWYFLPWHRGYLIALETVVRDAVTKLGGPADWALPYWNYFKTGQNGLPPAFASKDWPDGQGDNPLFVERRFGPDDDGNVFVPTDQVDLNALGDPDFVGPGSGGSQGFGGIETGFSHDSGTHGGIETQPHDQVHVSVGGGTQRRPGLMSDPDIAGLDPIFWLHHANIDRLWQVWRQHPTSDVDPTDDANWVNGPAAGGERAFVMPLPGGNQLTYTPGQMSDFSSLTYIYDDTSSPFDTPQPVARLRQLGVPTAAAETLVRRTAMAGPRTKNVELVGASTQGLRVSGREAHAALALDPGVQRKVTQSLRAATAAAAPAAPDRVFLNLENVRGLHDGTAFKVYLNVPDGADPAQFPTHLAGSIALFGVRKASLADDKHAGHGLTFVLEITRVIDALHLAGALDAGQLHVRLVPRKPVADEDQITIGRISVYRQSA